jgi:N-acetylglucosamine malate deacetylase 1
VTTLVFAAHPDDEVLGAGGTVSRLAGAGEQVHIHILGEGGTSRIVSEGGDKPASLEDDARRAVALLGATSVSFHGLPDNRFDSIDMLDVVQRVEAILGGTPCDRILTHSLGDLNIDHRVTAQAVLTATRPISQSAPAEILSFEVLSSSEWSFGAFGGFEPNYFIEITEDDLERKVAALREYRSELRDAPHPRSVDGVVALARLRGVTVGVPFAESFVSVRTVNRLVFGIC